MNDELGVDDLILRSLANPKGDELVDELESIYVLQPTDTSELSDTHLMAYKAGKRDLVLMIRQILIDGLGE